MSDTLETRRVVESAKVVSEYGKDVRVEFEGIRLAMSPTSARDLADLLYTAANRCEGRIA